MQAPPPHFAELAPPHRGDQPSLETTFYGHLLSERALAEHLLDFDAIPQDPRALEKLRSIVDLLARESPDPDGLRSHVGPVIGAPNPRYPLRFMATQRDIGPRVEIEVVGQVKHGDYITLTMPFEPMHFVHSSSPRDARVFDEVNGDVPAARTLRTYAVQAYASERALILNLVRTPAPEPRTLLVFAAKSKKEVAWFLDEAFQVGIFEGLHMSKNMQRLARVESDAPWTSR
jgi:hypothetical protein